MQGERKRIFLLVTDVKLSWVFSKGLISALKKENCEVFYAGPGFDEELLACVKSHGVVPVPLSLKRTELNPFRDFLFFLSAVLKIRKERPGILITRQAKANVFGILAAWINGVPKKFAIVSGLGYSFTDTQGQDATKKKFVRIVQSMLYKAAFHCADMVLFQNKDDLNELVRRSIVKRCKTFLMGATGVSLAEWSVAPPHFDPLTFTLVARILREKGVLEYVEAAKMVKKRFPSVRFLLIGPIDSNPGAIPEKQVREWVNEEIIEWIPWTSDIRYWLLQTSVFVLPSYREGVPRSTQEALAMARPVITTDVPGCRETVINGGNGWLVRPQNPKELSEKMIFFINNPDKIKSMGLKSRALAETKFDEEKINHRLLCLLGLKNSVLPY